MNKYRTDGTARVGKIAGRREDDISLDTAAHVERALRCREEQDLPGFVGAVTSITHDQWGLVMDRLQEARALLDGDPDMEVVVRRGR